MEAGLAPVSLSYSTCQVSSLHLVSTASEAHVCLQSESLLMLLRGLELA